MYKNTSEEYLLLEELPNNILCGSYISTASGGVIKWIKIHSRNTFGFLSLYYQSFCIEYNKFGDQQPKFTLLSDIMTYEYLDESCDEKWKRIII